MAGNILTPTAIWGRFSYDNPPITEAIDQTKIDNLSVERFYIGGRQTKEGTVKIFATKVKKAINTEMPAVLILNDFVGDDGVTLAIEFAKKGFTALVVDVAGEKENQDRFTIYPKDVSYANYKNAKDKLLTVELDVPRSCWYEWGVVAKYAVNYLCSIDKVSKVGAVACGEVATVLWHLSTMEDRLSAVTYVMNAGWRAYRGLYKFSGSVEPQYSDDVLKFIAGVEPQSYAQHVNCPTLVLSALNSSEYDCDRIYDTVDRIKEGVFRGVYFSAGFENGIDEEGFKNMFLFFKEFLGKTNPKDILVPKEPLIRCEAVDNILSVEVEVDQDNLKEVSLCFSKDTINPALRVWNKTQKCKKVSGNKYLFEIDLFSVNEIITVYAEVKYKKGLTLCTNILAKKVSRKVMNKGYRQKLIYSSREDNAETVFLSCKDGRENLIKYFETCDSSSVQLKNGPMDIKGVCCNYGIRTFKINCLADKPSDYAILMFDAYVKNDGEITVSLITDYQGQKITYSTRVHVNGGAIWHSVKLELSKFKTDEGRILKSFEKIQAIEFKVEGEYLLNNVLWV